MVVLLLLLLFRGIDVVLFVGVVLDDDVSFDVFLFRFGAFCLFVFNYLKANEKSKNYFMNRKIERQIKLQ